MSPGVVWIYDLSNQMSGVTLVVVEVVCEVGNALDIVSAPNCGQLSQTSGKQSLTVALELSLMSFGWELIANGRT